MIHAVARPCSTETKLHVPGDRLFYMERKQLMNTATVQPPASRRAAARNPILRVAAGVIRALRLALPKIGVGWMFALLTVNFNRVTIKELGVAAVLITIMTGMHNFLSPFQVVFGRFADRHPFLGMRRTPMLLASTVVTSVVFLALPRLGVAMGQGSLLAVLAGFGLLIIFGIGIAVHGDAHHSLIAEVTDERSRGGVISVVWTFLIMSTIASAITIKVVMPTYTLELMQQLYNLTPLIVIGSALLGLLGVERRLKGAELAEATRRSREMTPPGNPLRVALTLVREQPQVRTFFMFVFLSILGVFIQDAILEVFGGEVFNMTPGETASFTSTWGGGVLASMILVGVLSGIFPIGKKMLAGAGALGTALGLAVLTLAALSHQRALITPALIVMGISTGAYNVGALSMMMEMTFAGATGMYMGLWGVAQAFGMGFASIISGGLHSLLIETGLLSASLGYTAIFGLEALVMLVAVGMLRAVSVAAFHGLTHEDIVRSMEATATA